MLWSFSWKMQCVSSGVCNRGGQCICEALTLQTSYRTFPLQNTSLSLPGQTYRQTPTEEMEDAAKRPLFISKHFLKDSQHHHLSWRVAAMQCTGINLETFQMGAQRTVWPHTVAQPWPCLAWCPSRLQPFHNRFCNNAVIPTSPLSQLSVQLGTNLAWPKLCQLIMKIPRKIHENSSDWAQEAAAVTPATHPADVTEMLVGQALNCHILYFYFFPSKFQSHANYKEANSFKILKVYPLWKYI